MTTPTMIAHFYVKINGADAPQEFMNSLKRIEVDSSLHMPAMATIELYDSKLKWVDDTTIAIGAEIEVSARANDATAPTRIFAGVIAAHEPEFVLDQEYCVMVVRAYDRLHFLHRGNVTKTFTQMTDSAIAQAVIAEAGLSAQVTATTGQNEHFYRGDLSNYDLLQFLARRNGYVVIADARSVHFKPPDALGKPTVVAEYGKAIRDFRPTLTTTGQVNEVSVSGWDPAQKSRAHGTISTPTLAPTATGIDKRGPAIAQAAQSATAKLHFADVVNIQGAAQSVAKAMLNRIVAGDLVAEGSMDGSGLLAAGGKLTVRHVGTRFSGTYLISRVRHVFNVEEGYYTEFWLGGMSSGTVGTLINSDDTRRTVRDNQVTGLMVGIVTDNKDDKSWGRVKVKLPAFTEDHTSWWAPVVSAGAGANRGFFAMPEVNDEVIVAFANGDLNQPFVLGGVWNGKDATPSKQGAAVTSSGVEIREFKTRVGHVLRFTDTSGSEKIELLDKTGNNKLVIESADGAFTIDCTGPMTINAGKDATIVAKADATIKAQANITVTGTAITVEAKSKLSLKAPSIEIAGQAMVKISGGLVQIN